MKCQNCGRELKNGARFCIACGAQHDENGQLIGGKSSGRVDYDKTMMASGGSSNYDKTMMSGSTGFNQYQSNQASTSYQQYDSSASNNYASQGYSEDGAVEKKRISPILIVAPIIIIGALAFSFFQGRLEARKAKKVTAKTQTQTQTETNVQETTAETSSAIQETQSSAAVATSSSAHIVEDVTEIETTEMIVHLDGYWSADANYFYINGEMQKNLWVEDYYVGEDGKKVVSRWVDEKYYVDSTGKKARNEWIEFPYTDIESGQKKKGFYYVGSNGLKVTDKVVDGRYLNKDGCYFPNGDDEIVSEMKGGETKSAKSTTETAASRKEETTAETSQTTAPVVPTTAPAAQTTAYIEPTTAAYVAPTAATIIMETAATAAAAQVNAAPASNVIVAPGHVTETAASGGNAQGLLADINVQGTSRTIGYRLVSEGFPALNITKFDSIAITDTNFPQLATVVNLWNIGRDRSGFPAGSSESMSSDVVVGKNSHKVFSICETITKYNSGFAYHKERIGQTWDPVSGEPLDIHEFLRENKLTEFAQLVLARLKPYAKRMEEEMYDEFAEMQPMELFEHFNWYMTDTDMVIMFDSDNVGLENNINGITLNLDNSTVSSMIESMYR